MAAEVIEAALASGDAPAEVVEFVEVKVRLRKLLDDMEAAERRDGAGGILDFGGFDGPVGPSGSRGMGFAGSRGFEMPGSKTPGFEGRPARAPNAEKLESLRAEFGAGEARLAELKERVSRIPGFEVIGRPLEWMTQERVEAALQSGEALVLALPLEREDKVVALEPGAAPSAAGDDEDGASPLFATSFWVLRKGHAPQVVSVPEAAAEAMTGTSAERIARWTAAEDQSWTERLPGLAVRFAAFSEAMNGRGGMRRGGYDEDAATGEAEADAAPAPRAKLAAEALPGFWPAFAAAMDRLVWTPLRQSGALAKVAEILLATSGPLHNLPFAAGMREGFGDGTDDPRLWHVNSLVTWALGRGLYADPEAPAGRESQARAGGAAGAGVTAVAADTGASIRVHTDAVSAPSPRAVSVLSNPASTDIPFAALEHKLVARIWAEHAARLGQQGGVDLQVLEGHAYPWEPELAVRLVHMGCHGTVATPKGMTPRPLAMLPMRRSTTPDGEIAPYVGEREVLSGPRALEVLKTLCVAGMGYDDLLDGDPTGLSTAWLRNGTHSVGASLPPVPDRRGCYFGVVTTLLMTDPEAPLPLAEAMLLARRIVGEAPSLAPAGLQAHLRDLAAETLQARIKDALAIANGDYLLTMLGTLVDTRTDLFWWLPAAQAARQAVIGALIALIPADRATLPAVDAIADLLQTHLPQDLLPDPQHDPAEAGSIRYGMTLFGDPARRHKAA